MSGKPDGLEDGSGNSNDVGSSKNKNSSQNKDRDGYSIDINEIEAELMKEENELGRDIEISRIINCFKLDSYSILELQPGVSLKDINQKYRKKSLLIHPDKNKNNPNAAIAFDILKKNHLNLTDEKLRKNLDQIYEDARKLIVREEKISVNNTNYFISEEFSSKLKNKVKEILIEEEFLRRMEIKENINKEVLKKQKLEQLKQERLFKKKQEKNWEDKREERVYNWRKYLKENEKKKMKMKKKNKNLEKKIKLLA
ncbi:J domain-containing protein ASCRUDRAFT_91571 [Ascoidea rubescens DSM 1968]|uniref:J domain-containing protein n=1 Tax=Ascoidea rubescens DSM 1968 TaxID=1344418 RepID=A0A1D2VGN1_9ASCO|nr:hypothetical protein ASCRUDRAFT_91571 [Ascoidea rubescens DSM 1968]ODV60831.1 hypothetical protein ASCRUDRAFT_91571 [Ascoidea rubescens DSM 1968]